jgi:hypothetical protein
MQPNRKTDTRKTRPLVSRLTLPWSYAIAAILLLLVEACAFVSKPLFDFEIPTMEWSRLPSAVFFSFSICIGLSCTHLGGPGFFPNARKLIALITAAYSIAALAAATAFAWLDFAGRDVTSNLPMALQDFLKEHSPLDPFGIGFWAPITLGALVALIGLMGAGYRRDPLQPFGVEFPILLVLLATAGCAAFVLGSASAERLSYALSGEIDPADIGWPVLPVTALGSLSAWIITRFMTRNQTPPRTTLAGETVNIEKALPAASKTSVLVLILLYLGISQTATYANRMAELVEAREGFAADALYVFFKEGGTLNATRQSPDGKPLESTGVLTRVPWADVMIVQYPGDERYIVQVTRKPTREKWSVGQYHQSFDTGKATQQVADRYGIRYEAADDGIRIYPRIEAQLRATEVTFPGTGVSLGLTSFAFLVPVVIFATLILFGHWVRAAIMYYDNSSVQWILIDADKGLVGLVARGWLAAIAVGPWLLSILFVQAVALTLRSKGTLNTLPLEGIASVYVALIMTMLLTSTASALRALLTLRALVRARRHGAK